MKGVDLNVNIELVLIIVGSILMATGAYFIYPPASLIVLGFLMLKLGWPEGDNE